MRVCATRVRVRLTDRERQFSNLGAPFGFGLCIFHSCSDALGSPIPSPALCLLAFFKEAFPIYCLMPMTNTALYMTMGKGLCCRKNKCMTSSSDQNREPFKSHPLVANSSLSPAPLAKAPKRQSGPLSVLILGSHQSGLSSSVAFAVTLPQTKLSYFFLELSITQFPVLQMKDKESRTHSPDPNPAAREELSRAGFLLYPRVSGPELEPVRIL